jgi:Kef-type K+ transport system membrane component KefB
MLRFTIRMSLHIISTFGLLLGISLLAGLAAEYVRLPKVTAFLLVGLLLGPSVLDLIPESHVASFDPLLKLAMALVLFGLGAQFPLRRIRTVLPRSLVLSAGDLIGTMIFVTGGLAICASFLPDMNLRLALLLGCLALATAPATTVLVLNELRSEGPVTQNTGILVVLNNLAAIIGFEIVLLTIQMMSPDSTGEFLPQFGGMLKGIAGAIGIGVIAGLMVSFGCGLMHSRRWLSVLVATTTIALGLCESQELPYMLTFLAMGLTVANSSDVGKQIAGELDHLGGLLSVLFFAVHGAELDLQAFLDAGAIGAAYIALRILGKTVGVHVAARITGQSPELRNWLGPTQLSQAGAAIALSTAVVHQIPELGRSVQTVILGSVVLFEIIGPLLIRQAVLRSGEVPIAAAIRHTSATPMGEVRDLWDSIRLSISGLLSGQAPSSDITIERLVQRGVRGIPESADFTEIISYIEHSHDNVYPVVNAASQVIGVIRYSALSDEMFDETVTSLVRAEDLTLPVHDVLHPDHSVMHAHEMFQKISDDCLPVVSRDEPQTLVGVLRRSDVAHVLIQRLGGE